MPGRPQQHPMGAEYLNPPKEARPEWMNNRALLPKRPPTRTGRP